MRYLAAIPIILLLVLLDLALLITIIGMFAAGEYGEYPTSYKFASKVWGLE
jgi:hypothetical protein